MSDLEKSWDLPEVTCPVDSIGHHFRPFDPAGTLPVLARAQTEEPVFYCPEISCWVVTRYADILAILQDPEKFSAANANTPITPLPPEALTLMAEGGYALEGVQVNCDPPRHTRIRASAARAMGMKRLTGLEPVIRKHLAAAIADLACKDEVDLMATVTRDLPARVIFALLGIPDDDVARVKDWARDRLLLSFSRPSTAAQMEGARNLLAFWHYCVDHVARKIAEPGDDYVSDLLALRDGDDAVLTLNEINSLAFGLLFAGHETTTSQMTSTIAAVLDVPGLWPKLGQEPALIPTVVEEGLRLFGAVSHWRRRALVDVTIGGVDVPAGSQILLSFAAANRDPARFAEPDLLDPHRTDARRHLTFGHGIHVCLGAPLARLEMRILLEELSLAFPGMRRIAGTELAYEPAFAFRVPTALTVALRG